MSDDQGEDSSSGFFGGGGGMDGIQTMGILNVLRTGDPQVDMVLAMCLPLLIRFLFGMVGQLDEILSYEYWEKWLRRDEHEGWHSRTVSHKTSTDAWGGRSRSSDEDTQNTVLLKAIQLYLHVKVNLGLRDANLDLTSMEDKNASVGRRDYYYDDDDEDGSSRTVVGILSKYKIIKKPPKEEWHKLGYYGDSKSPVELRIDCYQENTGGEETGNGGKKSAGGSSKVHSYHFVSPDGASIDAFIDTAFSWYMDELRKMEDNARYLYELKGSPFGLAGGGGNRNDSDAGGSDDDVTYTRYRLSDEKTFESLFFREKESLLNLIEHFKKKTGKYAIKGYPHKLGILLHGPPGSGKTSMIKALAQHTGRSIINVPLTKVTTNSELMSIFFDRKKYVDGEYVPVKLGFKDVIFVMEDVDAASKVVKRRDGKTAAQVAQEEADHDRAEVNVPPPKSMWRMLLESQDSDCKELVKLLMEKSERLKKEAIKPDVAMSVARKMMSFPGLSVVGEAGEDQLLRTIERDALDAANTVMDNSSTVDRFVGQHARMINSMIEAGTEVTDEFVDQLLGLATSNFAASVTPSSSTPLSVREESVDGVESDIVGQRDVLMAGMAKLLNDGKDSGGSSSSEGEGKTGAGGFIGPSPFSLSKLNKDQLNLTGLLNVLDGVVDSPGRIVIMTTNHVEHLDPALIRPGRIDKKLLLGYMKAIDVISMLEHYFQLTLSEKQRERVNRVISGESGDRADVNDDLDRLTRSPVNLTPAQVEQLTAEYDDIEDMICALEEKSRPTVIGTHSVF